MYREDSEKVPTVFYMSEKLDFKHLTGPAQSPDIAI